MNFEILKLILNILAIGICLHFYVCGLINKDLDLRIAGFSGLVGWIVVFIM